MTGADGGAGPGARPERRWDVALSFAGAQRDYVEHVAEALKARGVRCFYDADEQIDLWGKYLAEELPVVYGEQAAAVVVFVSAEYAARDWTRLERQAALARAVRERREYVLPARFDDTPLPGLLSDMVTVDLRGRSPQQFAVMIVGKLAALGIAGPAPPTGGGGPARDAEAAPPAGAVRVGEANPRRLGVHAAISEPGVSDEVLPEYVPRDVDAAEFGIRAKVAAAAQWGGFVLLVGGSSVGKTRCAVEAVKALLPEWWLVHPAGPAEVAALAHAPPRMVVWLDELQRYLDGEHGLTGGVVRALLDASWPVAIIGTLWPDRYAAYTALPAPEGADPHAREREVLDLAAIVRIGPEFSQAERARARAAAARDPRLRAALEAAGYGLTQTLAAAPQLVGRWQDAQTGSPYAWAVLTAALDAARLGARAPLSADFLRACAPGYCTSQQRAEAPDNWFEQALAYATGKLDGAVAALSPAGAGMGRIAGYTVADYLIQHAGQELHYVRVPDSTWDAILCHIRDAADAAPLADSARSRLLYRYAIPLYRRAAEDGDRDAAFRLADLLAGRGDLDEAVQVLRDRTDTGDTDAAGRLARRLAEAGDLDGLRAQADAGDKDAAFRLADLLARRGDLDEAVQVLRDRADSGDPDATRRLADLLAEAGDLDGLRARADAGDSAAAGRLARLLAEAGDLDGLRARADAGDRYAALRLGELLAQRGDLDEAVQVQRARADAGDPDAAFRLADLLARRGDLDGLRARADAGDGYAALRLAELLAGAGDLDALRARADAGDWHAASELARLLAGRGDQDGLRARADAGDGDAARQLADLLARRGDLDGAVQVLRGRAEDGDGYAAFRLAELLAGAGDLDGLRARADAGDRDAAFRLAELLAQRGDLDGAVEVLRGRADAGDRDAAFRLADLLAERGDLDGAVEVLRGRADAGDPDAARRLADLLAQAGDLDGLRGRADAGDPDAARRLADLLARRGDLDGLRARADVGDWHAASELARLLAGRGDLDGLRARAGTGETAAAEQLADLLIKKGRDEEAERLRRFGLNPDGSIACA
jgi:thioredoxin-like negative regulator of GroEL